VSAEPATERGPLAERPSPAPATLLGMRGWPVGLALWLLVLAGVELAAFLLVWRFFVQSEHGQLLDTVALTANSIGQARVENLVGTILNTLSAVSLALATAVVGFIALIRRRFAVALGAILLIVGANVTTQLAKYVIDRPDLGVDPQRATAGNSLPSGHTTIAASVVVALLLVLPGRVRGAGGILGVVFVSAAGVATLSAGWHRPSDAIAAVLVVGAWACAASLFIITAQRRHGDVVYGQPHRLAVGMLVLAGIGLLAGAAIALELTNQVLSTPAEELSRHRLLAAYAGGAMGIAGTASLVLASVLATVHRVVPEMVPVPADELAEPAARR
jgi:membrane-associated phospholipid phosphatase